MKKKETMKKCQATDLKRLKSEIGIVLSSVIEKIGFSFCPFIEGNPNQLSDSERDDFMKGIKLLRKAAITAFKTHLDDSARDEDEEVIALHHLLTADIDIHALLPSKSWRGECISKAFSSSKLLQLLEAASRSWIQCYLSEGRDDSDPNIPQMEWFNWYENLINIVYEFREQTCCVLENHDNEVPLDCYSETRLYSKLRSVIKRFIQSEICDDRLDPTQYASLKSRILKRHRKELLQLSGQIYQTLNEEFADYASMSPDGEWKVLIH